MTRIAVILGSLRPRSHSANAMGVVAAKLRTLPGVSVDLVDPRELPLVIPGPEAHAEALSQLTAGLQARLKAAAGVVMITPEYDGSLSAVMKLLIEYLGYPSVLAGKPVALVGVASGRIGALRAIEHLRGICSHIGCVVIPGLRSVAAVHTSFDERGGCVDPVVEGALQEVAVDIVRFGRALAAV